MRNLRLYYSLKTILPRSLQIRLRQISARRKRRHVADVWPILESAGRAPEGWKGWPDGKQFAVVLTHDVETARGVDRCRMIMEIEERLGFRSAFNFVPARYKVPADLRQEMVRRGFEVGVHGLYHDLSLFSSEKEFRRQAQDINRYFKDWGAVGFRSPYMVRNLAWIRDYLDIEYDSSTFDTDPFEPQPDGVRTIFPFFVDGEKAGRPGYIELPCTLPQDLNLFVLLGETGIDVWKRKLDWIVASGGMALFDTHPDYMQELADTASDEYPVQRYVEFLEHVRARYADQYWHALPRDVAKFCRSNPESVRHGIPRRVCMLAYAFCDTDNRILRYAETLAERGDEVEAIGLRRHGQSRTESINGVHFSRIQARKRDEKGKIDYVTRMLRFMVHSSLLLTCRHLRKPYDLIHVHSVPDFEVFAAWAAKLMGAKVILDIHDIVPEFYVSKFGVSKDAYGFKVLLWVERMSARFADHVIIANHLWYQRLIRRAVPGSRCTAIPNYVDTRTFYPYPRTRDDDRLVLIYPGGLQKHQGLDIAIHAFQRVSERLPRAEFHIYGEGPEKDNLNALIESLGLRGKASIHDSVDIRFVPALLANADIGVVPKRADGFGDEAYSTKILEFMSQGIPVVASRTTIDQFYFGDGSVHFFESGSVDDLARCILELAVDPELRGQLAEKGRAYVARNNWTNKEHEYLGVMDRLFGGSSRFTSDEGTTGA